MTPAMDIDHLRTWIGREQHCEDTLTPSLLARFNAAFDRSSPAAPVGEVPVLLHFCLAQPAVVSSGLGPDGHPAKGDFLPPVPLPRRMWAGGALSFHHPLTVGATIARRSVIDDVAVKEGRSGTLCFVTVRHDIVCDGTLAISERQDIVYRAPGPAGAPARATSADAANAAAGAQGKPVRVNEAMLFRYSALTFNSHRIHYDAAYARDVEGYPALVVHGPLQATLLCQFAADLRGAPPREFRFRSAGPLFCGEDFGLNASADGDGLRLWTAIAGAAPAMEAWATW